MPIYSTKDLCFSSGCDNANAEALLYEALRRYGIKYPPKEVASIGFTRWGKNNRYWALACYDGYVFGDFTTDLVEKVFPSRKYSKHELKMCNKAISEAKKEAERLQEERHMEAAHLAFKIWEAASPIVGDEADYLKKKHVPSFGLRHINREQLLEAGFDIVSAFGRPFANNVSEMGFIIIPLINPDSSISSVQFINTASEDNKRFLPGGCKKGCYYQISNGNYSRILLCEGYVTGASIHIATDITTICCFDAGNLLPVAVNMKQLYPRAEIIICADNDDFTKDYKGNLYNKGKEEAKKAGNAIGAYVVYPIFKDLKGKPTDFNDLHRREGLDAVKEQISRVYSGDIQ